MIQKKWWQDKVAYQIYPKSFNDTNGDGIGDIRGIIDKLDYLKELGIDIIWISPIYKSPFIDQGYDISDYYKIAEEFGTMEEFDELLSEAKKRNMYIVMDLVVNHCSDKHEWFQKALADPEGEYADYFYFREGKDGRAPNNVRSYFGGSIWEPIEGTNKYYLHSFAKEQPDLNWENPKVRQEIYKMINWWLEKGVAGFRIDAIINIAKNLDFPDYPVDGEDGLSSIINFIADSEGIGQKLEELKHETFDKYNAFTVGEVFNMKDDELAEFVGDNGHFSTMFDFTAEVLTSGEDGWHSARKPEFKVWRDAMFESQEKCEDIGFLANIIENHDEPRGANNYLPSYAQNNNGVKMLATTSILLRGIPFIYQGQEIGMRNCKMDSIADYDDIETINQYNVCLEVGLTEAEALDVCYKHSRDNARTPMQWSSEGNAGFTTGKPWLKVNPNYKDINVEDQLSDESSVLRYYQKLIALRKSTDYSEVFTYGTFIPRFTELDNIYSYSRRLDNKEVLVVANYSREKITIDLEEVNGVVILSNTDRTGNIEGRLELSSCEVMVIEII